MTEIPIPKNPGTFTEIRAAERFVLELDGNALFNLSTKTWHVWNGKCWEVDNRNIVNNLARKFAKSLFSDAGGIDIKDLGNYLQDAKKLNGRNGINNLVALASIQLTRRSEDFDSNMHLLNLQNGTLEFKDGGITFREHRKADMCSFICSVAYDPMAPVPELWLKHINTVSDGDAELADNLQTILGYTLDGGNPHEYLLLLHGGGRNGKSATLRTLLWILGDYGITVNPLSLMEHGNKTISPERIKMRNRRLIVAQEPNKQDDGSKKCDTSTLDCGFLKAASGKDEIPARELYSNVIEDIRVSGLITFSTNPLPKVTDGSIAFWERMISIPFGYIIPPWARDPFIEDKFREMSSGILNWLLAGLQKSKSGRIDLCRTIRADILEYRATADEYAAFLDSCVGNAMNGRVTASSLYDAYCEYKKKRAEAPVNITAFGLAMKTRLNTKRTTAGIEYVNIQIVGEQVTW